MSMFLTSVAMARLLTSVAISPLLSHSTELMTELMTSVT